MNSVVDYMQLPLPKWPQMVVSGVSVTVEQAKEIILRTDDFLTSISKYAGGNHDTFNNSYREAAGLIGEDWELEHYVRDEIGYIETSFVFNNWASSSYIAGPHGWCNPTGRIHFNHNVGKWPEVSDIYADWVMIARAFPFLELSATLTNGEWSEENTSAVCTIYVKNGTVEVKEPSDVSLSIGCDENVSFEKLVEILGSRNIFDDRTEIGLPLDWYDDYAVRIKAIVAKYHELEAVV
jgi:hypothetical protein